jgi:flavin reductase (DIM6/NTAB) family NADH-FMN oxidoreductase RutF
MQTLKPDDLTAKEAYKLLTGVIVPRPIAWVSTRSLAGTTNLAPFSYFTSVSHKPPMLGINIGQIDGARKDTARNILETENFVVNIAHWGQLQSMHASADSHPPEISEIDLLGLQTTASELIAAPRLTEAPVQMECVFRTMIPFGSAGSEFFVGEVVAFHFRDDIIDLERLRIDSVALEPICRLGGPFYASLGEINKQRPRQ